MVNYKEIIEKSEKYGIERLLKELNVNEVHQQSGTVRSCCPFHNGDNNTAFSYSNGYFFCYSHCKKSFNIIDVVKNQLDTDFVGAINFLEERIGTISSEKKIIRKNSSKTNKHFLNLFKEEKEKNIEFNLENKIFKNLKEYPNNEFTKEVCDFFELKIATEGKYKDRIIIPIYEDNKLKGFSGRSLMSKEELDFKHENKYKFAYGFDKNKYLYNYDIGKKASLEKGYLIVVEGYKSVWRLHEWGYDNAVAVMGSFIDKKQKIKILTSLTDVIICGDKDIAGIELNRLAVDLLSPYTNIKVFDMFKTNGKETDSISDITKEEFESVLKELL